MKVLAPVLSFLFLFLFLFPACGDDTAKAAGKLEDATKGAVDATKDLLAKQAPAFEKVKGSIGSLTTTLAGIKDGATAESAKATLEGLVGTLQTQLGDLGSLGTLANSLMTEKAQLFKGPMEAIDKLLANADVKGKIGGVLEQLLGLLK